MKLSNSYFYTIRENAKDEESTSGNLLVRSGMIKKVGTGIYMYLPLGLKVLEKIKKVIKEEMDNSNAQELLMPSLIPRDYYETCGRVKSFGEDMFNLKDRYEKPLVLGPTHEELFAIAAKSMVRSYKDLPFILYQQADKFRDEPRPRYGLIRVREFIMKDAYSFDKDDSGLDKSYSIMKDAYNRIFDRLKIKYKIVKADTGAMGGSLSEEYQALTDIGEDTVVLCDSCDYSSNLEIATFTLSESNEEKKPKELVETKDKHTIEEVSEYLKIDPTKTIKALLMNVNEELVVFFIRGDRELNVNKVSKLLKVKNLNFASDELISTSNAVPGFTGPINLKAKIIIDSEILKMRNFCCGANKKNYHYINVNIDDFKYDIAADISNVLEGDICPKCGGKIYFKKGIEVGNLFKLGTKYSEKLNLTYLDEFNQEKPVVMGSYGIGPGRIMASIVEQNNDEFGIIWPEIVAPFKVAIIPISIKDEAMLELSNRLYDELKNGGVEVLLDDRDERPGVKFKDVDLIGIPYRIVVGKKAKDNIVELKLRNTTEITELTFEEVLTKIQR